MNELPEIQVINFYRNYFARNKDHSKIISILNENRDRIILLNTRHNIIETHFFTGEYGQKGNGKFEKTDIDWFGVSHDVLDILFKKYKNSRPNLINIARFCLNSKSKTYWSKIKDSLLAQEIMAAMLGGTDENA